MERRRCVILSAGNFRSASLFSVLKRHRPARTVRLGLFTDSGRSTVATPASAHRSTSPPLPPPPRCFSERVFGARSCLGGNFFRLFLVTAHFSLWRCDVTPLLFPLCALRPLLSPPPSPLERSYASGWTWITSGETLIAPRGEFGAPRLRNGSRAE